MARQKAFLDCMLFWASLSLWGSLTPSPEAAFPENLYFCRHRNILVSRLASCWPSLGSFHRGRKSAVFPQLNCRTKITAKKFFSADHCVPLCAVHSIIPDSRKKGRSCLGEGIAGATVY